MGEWYRNASFWTAVEPFLFAPLRMAQGAQEVEDLSRTVALHPRSSILDLCCGVGRHSLAFAQRGHTVMGIDLTPVFIAKAAAAAKSLVPAPNYCVGDMYNLKADDTFDLIVCLYHSFGYGCNREADQEALSAMQARTKSGGAVVVDVLSYRQVQNDGIGSRMVSGETMLYRDRRLDERLRQVEDTWRIVSGHEELRHVTRAQLYSTDELDEMLHAAGFRYVAIYGNLAGGEHFADRGRSVFVARTA